MNRDYLGDSYDAVKRLWQQALSDWAALHAEPDFIPKDIRESFTRLTGIPVPLTAPSSPYSILNDPDTGIRQPNHKTRTVNQKHITLQHICKQLQRPGVRAVITFDQSALRDRNSPRAQQRLAKMRFLTDAGFLAFYYVSHAPFLFAFPDAKSAMEVRRRLLSVGIPDERLQQS